MNRDAVGHVLIHETFDMELRQHEAASRPHGPGGRVVLR